MNSSSSGLRKVYLCKICGVPKKGHICRGAQKSHGVILQTEELPEGAELTADGDEASRGKRGRKAVTRYTDEDFESPREREAGGMGPDVKVRKRSCNSTAPEASLMRGVKSQSGKASILESERGLGEDENIRKWHRAHGRMGEHSDVWWARVDVSKKWLQNFPKQMERWSVDGSDDSEEANRKRDRIRLASIRPLEPKVGNQGPSCPIRLYAAR
jgi:hypothetical protein